MVEAKDRGHNFSKLWSTNFPYFLNAKVFQVLFEINSKILVSKKIKAILNFYMVAADVDFVP